MIFKRYINSSRINANNYYMIHLNFFAADSFDINNLKDIKTFVDHYAGFQTVSLDNESEFHLLLQLMDINEPPAHALHNAAFIKYWDLSEFKFPEFGNEEYDLFYQQWIIRSNRENTMNEFGSLIFLSGLSPEWNRLKFRIVVQETD